MARDYRLPPDADPAIPLSIAERIARAGERTDDRVARLERTLDDYVSDVAPHVKRLHEIEEAREAARAKADAERLEARSGLVAVITSKPALVIYSVLLTAFATFLADLYDFGPTRVQAEVSAAHAPAEVSP